MNHTVRKRLLLTTGFILLAQSAPAFAQADATARAAKPDGDTADKDIIVTARRIDERLQDVPISITVFNQNQLANRNITTSTDLAKNTPSLTANTNFGSSNTTFAIRGFTQTYGTTPSVATYFADVVEPRGPGGIPAGDVAPAGSFFDLQNVQVLKGPQGTLFGRNTTGGAILLVPQRPTQRLDGYIEGSYGNYDMKRIQGVINLPMSENAALRLGVDRQTRDGYVRNDSGTGPARFNGIDYLALRASLILNLTPNLENYTIASYSRSNTAGDIQKITACNPSKSPANFLGQLACGQLAAADARGAGFYTAQNDMADPVSKIIQWSLINTTTLKASDSLTIKNIVSYSQLSDTFRGDIFGSDFFLAPGLPITFADIRNARGRYGVDQSTVTEEFQLIGNTRNLTWQAGGYFESSSPLSETGGSTPVLLTCSNAAAQQCADYVGLGAGAPVGSIQAVTDRENFRNLAVFGQGTYAFTDTLKLTAGVRYTDDIAKSANERTHIDFYPPPGPTSYCTSLSAPTPPNIPVTSPNQCLVRLRQHSSAPTWLIDLDYKPSEDTLLYAKYSRGYRQGSVFPNAADGFETFRPERVDSYEAGAKLAFHEAIHGTLNLAGFYNDFRDQQLQVQFSGPAVASQAGIVNAGKSRIFGGEVEASITPFHGFKLDASYAYLNSKLVSITPPALRPGGVYTVITLASFPGDPLPLTPKHKLSLSGTYTLPLSPDIGRISIGSSFVYTSRQLVNRGGPNANVQPTSLVNLSLDWNNVAGGPVDLSVFVTNLTDRHYYSYVGGNYNAAGFEYAGLSEPRIFGGRLRLRFGQ